MVSLHSSPPVQRPLARLSLLGILLLGMSVSQGCGRKESAKAEKKGFEALLQNDYDLAIADFNEAIRLNPNDGDAYYGRGCAYYEKGDHDRAIADESDAIRLDPTSGEAYHKRGSAYEHKRHYDKAIADYSEWIRIYPGDPDAYHTRGTAYLFRSFPHTQDDYDNAIADYSEVIRIDTNSAVSWWRSNSAHAYSTRASAYQQKGDYDKAVSDYSEAIRIDTNSADSYSSRASAYESKGDYDKAIADYSEAIRLKSDFDTYNSLATLYALCPNARFRNGEKAVEYAKKACELSDEMSAKWRVSKEMGHDRCLGTLADAYAEAGNFDEAVKCASKILESSTSKEHSEIWRQRLGLYEQKRTYHYPNR